MKKVDYNGLVKEGNVYAHWKVLVGVADKKRYPCVCVHCGNEKMVYKVQLLDERNKRTKDSRCKKCTNLKEGTVYSNFFGVNFKIVKYFNSAKVLISFPPDDLCPEGYTKFTKKCSILSGNVPYPFYRKVSGVGYYGAEYNILPKDVHIKDVWTKVIKRCYNPNLKDISYVNCTVCDEWHSYYNFYHWYKANTINGYYHKGYQIDKDLLSIGNNTKVYSPETCRLVPDKINSFLNNFEDTRNTGTPSGVTWKERNKKYQIQVKDENSDKVYLGLTEDPSEGYEIYRKEKEKIAKRLAIKYTGLVVPEILQVLNAFKCPDWDWDNNCYIKG